MISVERKSDVENCPVCGKMAVRVYLVTLGALTHLSFLQFVICRKCLDDLKYEIFPHTRWP